MENNKPEVRYIGEDKNGLEILHRITDDTPREKVIELLKKSVMAIIGYERPELTVPVLYDLLLEQMERSGHRFVLQLNDVGTK